MVSLIKNQLLKHLSRYTKNLSSDKINLSTFRGEGDLKNLELDEVVLTELLELPAWLRLTEALCNRVSFRISWTKLKTVPITLTLDEVNIKVMTCDANIRINQDKNLSEIDGVAGGKGGGGGGLTGGGGSASSIPHLPQAPQGKYRFINKIIDGITIIVNTVNVHFESVAFTASVQMSQIRVVSKTPKWENGELHLTWHKDRKKGIVMIFKELSWQTVRIEASSTQDRSLKPLRLLTNHARCRIRMIKRLSDCSLLASRLVLILDDLLWVLTDSQLKAALHFVDSLSGLVKEATHVTQKQIAARKLQTLQEYQQLAQQQHQQSDSSTSAITSGVRETSYHFVAQRIDLHLCDDESDGHSSYPDLDKGGALQISIHSFQIDYYPYHLATSDRTHWAKNREAAVAPALWLKESLNAFRESVLDLGQPNRPPPHAPLERATPATPATPASPLMLNVSALNSQHFGIPNSGSNGTNTPTNGGGSLSGGIGSSTPTSSKSSHVQMKETLDKLMSACVILRIKDFTLYRVTTNGKKQMPKEFIAGEREAYPPFPSEMPILHAEFTYFYYPGDLIFPLPPSKMYVHVNPIQIQFDLSSILWLHSFGLNLQESFLRTNVVSPTSPSNRNNSTGSAKSPTNSFQNNNIGHGEGTKINEQLAPDPMYMDVKVEAILPRITIESAVDVPNQKDRPKIMQIQISRFALTNIREMGSSRADLAEALHSLQKGSLIFGTEFPSAENDMYIITDRILAHVAASDVGGAIGQSESSLHSNTAESDRNSNMPPIVNRGLISKSNSMQCLSRYAMWSEPRDVWCIKLDPVWVEFLGTRSIGSNKAIPFVDAVPITIWLHSGNNNSDIYSKFSLGAAAAKADFNATTAATAATAATADNIPNGVYGSDTLTSIAKDASHIVATTNDSRHINVHTNSNANTNTYSSSNVQNIPLNPFLSEEDLRNPLVETKETSFERTADMHAIAHISNLVSIQIDHYQLLFLLRLAEEINEMTTFLALDTKRILQTRNEKKSMIFGCVVPQIEVTLVMPSPTPGKESSGGDAESVLPDSASLGDDLHMNSTSANWLPPTLEQIRNNTFGSVETPSPIANDSPYVMHMSNPNTHGFNVQIQSTPTLASSTTTSQTSRLDTGIYSQSAASSSSKSWKSTKNSSSDQTNIKKDINFGLMSMKKGFSSFMTSIDTAIKATGGPIDDISDTFSIQSDISSNSETNVYILGDERDIDCLDGMFSYFSSRLSGNGNNVKVSPVEIASEVYEEPNYKTNLSSPSEPSEASTWRRRDLVSMATFRLTTVELIRQNEGNQSTLRAQVAAVSCNECGAIPWDELQSKFNARCKAWNLAPYNPEAPPCIRLRFEETLNTPDDLVNIPDKKCIQSWFDHKAEIRMKDISLDLNMSTIVGLGELTEDEVISSNPLPVNILVENVKINLIEDRPPVNITSPGPVPINLDIGRVHVERDSKGVLHIQPIESNLNNALHASQYPLTAQLFTPAPRERDRELVSLQLVMQQLKLDNEQLRKQISNVKENAESYRQKAKQENETLRSYLKAAHDKITLLTEEKTELIDTICALKVQVNSLSATRKSDGNR